MLTLPISMKIFYDMRMILILCFVLWTPINIMAQTTITGTVVDKNNAPIPGARVEIAGSSEYVVTDIDGTFRIEVPSSAKHLKVSYPGLTTSEPKIKPDMVVKLGNGWGGKTKGYRGSFDFNFGFAIGHVINEHVGNNQDRNQFELYYGLLTTHGYQINSHLFVGAGIGISLDGMIVDYNRSTMVGNIVETSSIGLYYIPVYSDIRWTPFRGRRVCPFVDMKIGYQFGGYAGSREITCKNINGIYIMPSVGIRFGKTKGFNLGIGYRVSPVRKLYDPLEDRVVGESNKGVFLLTLGGDF